MDLMNKLHGHAYLDYWQKRMALGPEQAGFDGRKADRQGVDIWSFMSDWLKRMDPKSVLDFGCGYGRMMRRLHSLWPKAKIQGDDICKAAVDSIAHEPNFEE